MMAHLTEPERIFRDRISVRTHLLRNGATILPEDETRIRMLQQEVDATHCLRLRGRLRPHEAQWVGEADPGGGEAFVGGFEGGTKVSEMSRGNAIRPDCINPPPGYQLAHRFVELYYVRVASDPPYWKAQSIHYSEVFGFGETKLKAKDDLVRRQVELLDTEGWSQVLEKEGAPKKWGSSDDLTLALLAECLEALQSLPQDALGTASSGTTHWYIRDELMARVRDHLVEADKEGEA